MIKLQVIGNVGRDAEIHDVNGKKSINFTVASNKAYTDGDGNRVEKTTWVSCTMWRDQNQSTKVAEFIKKGSKIFVEGSPEIKMYKDSDNKTQSSLNLTVANLELISVKEDE